MCQCKWGSLLLRRRRYLPQDMTNYQLLSAKHSHLVICYLVFVSFMLYHRSFRICLLQRRRWLLSLWWLSLGHTGISCISRPCLAWPGPTHQDRPRWRMWPLGQEVEKRQRYPVNNSQYIFKGL